MKNKYLTKKRNVSKSRKTKVIKHKTMRGGSNGSVKTKSVGDQTLKRQRSGSTTSSDSMKRQRSGSTSSSHYAALKPRYTGVTPEIQKQRYNTNKIVKELMGQSTRNGSDRYEKILPFMNAILSKISNGAQYMHATQKEIGIADVLKNANLNPILKEKIAHNFSLIPKEQVEEIGKNLQEVKRKKESILTKNNEFTRMHKLLTARQQVNGQSQGLTRIQKIPEDVKNKIILMSLGNNSKNKKSEINNFENKKSEINNLLAGTITTPEVRVKMSNYLATASLGEIQKLFNKTTTWSEKQSNNKN